MEGAEVYLVNYKIWLLSDVKGVFMGICVQKLWRSRKTIESKHMDKVQGNYFSTDVKMSFCHSQRQGVYTQSMYSECLEVSK